VLKQKERRFPFALLLKIKTRLFFTDILEIRIDDNLSWAFVEDLPETSFPGPGPAAPF